MNSTFSTLAKFLGFSADASQPEQREADIARNSPATVEAYDQGMTIMRAESDDDDFHTTGGMSLVRTAFAIAAVWATAIATVFALGA